MAEHSPLPWKASDLASGIVDDLERGIVVCNSANAAFIVKAVNAYDEMQEVLADLWLHFSTTDDPALRSIVEHARRLLPDPGTLDDVGGVAK